MTERERLLASARKIGEALERAYKPEVLRALRSGDPRELGIVKLRFETDYRRQTNHIVYLLARIPSEPLVVPK